MVRLVRNLVAMTKQVLYIDIIGARSLPSAEVLRIAASTAEVICVTTPEAALAVLRSQHSLKAMISNCAMLDIFLTARKLHPKMDTILITEHTMEQYSQSLDGREHLLVDHVIVNRNPPNWSINELRITVQKILREDIFGLSKYLNPTTPVREMLVTGSSDRDICNTTVMNFAEENRLGQYLAKLVFGITEELLMNAIYDAPLAGGRNHYGELPRTQSIELAPDEYARLNFAFDGSIFGIAVSDPFGALTRDKLFEYLKKVLRRRDSENLIDTKKGGAGLGLFKILYCSHSLICNVAPGKQTEVIALIDIQQQVRDFARMPRSIHYFSAA